jgi:photosystem II stability/assembly factor-like uncharacterized protein
MHFRFLPIAIGLLLPILLTACNGGGPVSLADTHVHGLAVNRSDSSRLYIATHHGLFTLQNDGSTELSTGSDLSLVGSSRDDFMGFSPHPSDPNMLFSSGHPRRGGNLGILESTNGGKTWTKIHNGNPGGPADFHAMTVHAANPNHLYGWYKLRVHRSLDGGETWEVLPNQPPEILSFAGDPRDENVVYAGSIGALLMSTDRGETFVSIAPELTKDVVFDIEMDPGSSALILATRDHGFMRVSRNPEGGFGLEELGRLPNADIPYYLAIDPKNPAVLYSFSKAHTLFQSTDGAQSWQKLL